MIGAEKIYEPPVIHSKSYGLAAVGLVAFSDRTYSLKVSLSRVGERPLRVIRSATAGTAAACPVVSGLVIGK